MKKQYVRKKIVVTDTVFSMEGDIAPLEGIVNTCKSHDALLYLDDARGTGVLGNGKGALSHFNIQRTACAPHGVSEAGGRVFAAERTWPQADPKSCLHSVSVQAAKGICKKSEETN